MKMNTQFTGLATFVAIVLTISSPAGGSPLSNGEESSLAAQPVTTSIGVGHSGAIRPSSYPGNATAIPTFVTSSYSSIPTTSIGFPGNYTATGFPTTFSGPVLTTGFPGNYTATSFPTTVSGPVPTMGFPTHGHPSGCVPHTVTTTVFIYPSGPVPPPWYPPGNTPVSSSAVASSWYPSGNAPTPSSAVASSWFPPSNVPASSSAIASPWYPSGSVAYPTAVPASTTRVCGQPPASATPSSGNGGGWHSSYPGNGNATYTTSYVNGNVTFPTPPVSGNGTYPTSWASSATAYPTDSECYFTSSTTGVPYPNNIVVTVSFPGSPSSAYSSSSGVPYPGGSGIASGAPYPSSSGVTIPHGHSAAPTASTSYTWVTPSASGVPYPSSSAV